jgi:Flp pilus assembly protein TadB
MIALTFLRAVPWQAWLVAGLLAAAAAFHWQATNAAYEAGKAAEITKQETDNARARERAETELRRLDRGDRGGVSGFDRD